MLDFLADFLGDFISGILDLVSEPWFNKLGAKWQRKKKERQKRNRMRSPDGAQRRGNAKAE